MRDKSSTSERKAPIRPLIARAKKVAEDCVALQRRVDKRFPNAVIAVIAARLVKDSAWLALLLETYKHDQPGPDY